MADLEREASDVIARHCERPKCKSVLQEGDTRSCKSLSPEQVLEVFDNGGCEEAVIYRSKGRWVEEVKGVMTKDRFEIGRKRVTS